LNTIAYAVLVCACLIGGLSGSPIVLYAAATFVPWLQVMPRPFGMPSAAPNVLLAGLIASAVTGASKRPRPAGPLPLKKSILCMGLVLLLGLLIRYMREVGGAVFTNPMADQPMVVWYWLTPFVVYAFVFRLATDRTVAWRTLRFCELSIVGEGAITIMERGMGAGRATAHLDEPNRAGAYFAAGACLFLGRFLTSRGRAKLVYAVAWVFTIGGVFNSLSRGALVATAVGSLVTVAVFFVKARGRTGTKVVFLIILVVLLLNTAVFIPQSVIDRVASTFTGGGKETVEEGDVDSSTKARLLFWSIAWQNFKVQPIGVGTGTFPSLTAPYWERPMNAHNIYLQLLAEYGIQGLIALLILIASVAGYCYKSFVRLYESERAETALALMGWWTAHCVAHFFVNPFFLFAVNGQFWIMMACAPHLAGPIPPGASETAARRPTRGR
jgi:O-antigen ligase